jgi:GMP synthase-like glutamine amidotransferase
VATVQVGLLECDHVAPHLLAHGGDYGDMFVALAARAALHLELVRHDVVGGDVPAPDAHPAWLVTGSRSAVYDDEPWIARLLDLLRSIDAVGGSIVGVCFGHQAIAHALGGETARSDRGWGVGVHDAEVLAPRSWMEPALPATRLLMSHQDQVRALPPDAAVLARSAHCDVAVLEVAGRHLGIQGHPEFTRGYAEALLDDPAHAIPADLAAAARATLDGPTDGEVVMSWIGRFLSEQAAAAGPARDRGWPQP